MKELIISNYFFGFSKFPVITLKYSDTEECINYYPNDDASQRPDLQWRSHSNNLYTNWLNYYVYQATPYEW